MANPTDMSDERYAKQRGSVIARECTELRRKEANAIAWSELGYSRAGMADEDRLDTSESTVKTWHERAIALYGFEILEQHVTEDTEEFPEYERAGPEYLDTRTEEDQRKWIGIVDRYREKLPQGHVNAVLDEAEDRGMRPEVSL